MVRLAARALTVLAVAVYATGAPALTTRLSLATQPPIIDGRLSPEEKTGTSQVTLNVIGGIDRPRHPTTAFVSVTSTALYVAFQCTDPDPKSLVASAKDGGAVFLDDSAQLFLTPATQVTRTNYFHFAVNASGAKYSCSLRTDLPVDGWQAAAAPTDKGWECEMLIPFTVMDASLTPRYWRANFARERPSRGSQEQETTAWINPGASLHNYRRFGFLQLNGLREAVATLAVPEPTESTGSLVLEPPIRLAAGEKPALTPSAPETSAPTPTLAIPPPAFPPVSTLSTASTSSTATGQVETTGTQTALVRGPGQ